MERFESLRVTTPGATLAVRHYPGSGEPIVLLHGGPGMGNYFGAFPELLSPPYRAVSYDQRGCGASSCDGSFDVDDPQDHPRARQWKTASLGWTMRTPRAHE